LSIKTVIVDLESINPPDAPTESGSIVESLANSIIELRGLLRPPVLRSVGIDEYELLSGQLEFYAYLQARKFDESLPDRLTTFIIDKKHEDAIKKQLVTVSNASPSNSASTSIDLDNLAARLDRALISQQSVLNALQEKLETAIDQVIPQPFSIFLVLDRVSETKISVELRSCLAKLLGEKPKAKNPKSKIIVDLLENAKKKGIHLNSFAALVTATTIQKNGKNTRAISNKTIIEIIDGLYAWSIEYQKSDTSFHKSKVNQAEQLSPILATNTTEPQQLENKISVGFQAAQDTIDKLESSLVSKIHQSFPEPIDLLVACNRINEAAIAQQFTKRLAFLGDAKLTKIVEILQKAKKKGIDINSFKALQNLLINPQTKAKILGDQKMIDVIDRWYQ
jgi:hypothetical protein